MYLNVRNIAGFSALAALAAGSWYWNGQGAATDMDASQRGRVPLGYYLRGAQISVSDADGRILYEILADSAEERPGESRMLLERVLIRYTPAAEIPWDVRADRGEIPSDERYIDLIGRVELMSKPGAAQSTIIQTQMLRFEPDAFLATTDVAVDVVFGDERLQAVGMSANLRDDLLELESNVHGQFNP
jgi:LPS export ABC transporter protein LptC